MLHIEMNVNRYNNTHENIKLDVYISGSNETFSVLTYILFFGFVDVNFFYLNVSVVIPNPYTMTSLVLLLLTAF